ncbi:TIGR03032 family protein [Rubripirellula amarantea]|nr:TIGR03032 family protein [Rubripirellula amarantea]
MDIHDVAVEASGQVVFVDTLFGCLATLSDTHSFVSLWKPSFISELVAEDRCHLNGLALENSRAKYVTAVGQSDVADGWWDWRVVDRQPGRLASCVHDLGFIGRPPMNIIKLDF